MGMNWAMVPMLLLASIAAAGCASSAKSCTGTGTTSQNGCDALAKAASEIVVQASATTGAIRGVVVDTGIRPVIGALVQIPTVGGTKYTNSSSTGGFGFSDLKPGTYFVHAHKGGFLDIQVSTEVIAANSNPPLVKIQMTPDTSYKAPYHTVSLFKGFIECSIATPVVAYTLCSTANGYAPCSWFGIGPCVANLGNNTSDNFGTYIPVDSPPRFVQEVLEWTPTQPTNPNMLFELGADTRADWFYAQASVQSMNSTTGASPIVLNAFQSDLSKAGVGNTTGITPVVFTGGVPGTGAGILFQSGMSLEQDFQVYTIIFYGYQPPSGYNYATQGDAGLPY